MTDLPVCKLCQCEPNQSLSLADPGFRYNCDSHECPIAESGLTLTNEQWTALMGVDRDAVRYRWLRNNGHLDIWWSVEGPADRCANIDADIDTAMGEQQ